MTASVMHDGQLHVDEHTVRALLRRQFPEWADEPVVRLCGAGTVNAVFRIGDGLAARFPLVVDDEDAALRTLQREADAAAEFATVATVPSPIPVAIGRPSAGYPGPWAVTTWVHGDPVTPGSVQDSADFARDIAGLIRGLRATPTAGRAFSGAGRGGQLRDHDEWVATCLLKSRGLLDVDALDRQWRVFRELPRHDPDAMTHGDLIPANLLAVNGRLAGVIDVGGFGPADPALDLVVAWHVFERSARDALRDDRSGHGASRSDDELRWVRGAAWAFEQALGLVWYYERTNPAMSELGRNTLRRIGHADVVG